LVMPPYAPTYHSAWALVVRKTVKLPDRNKNNLSIRRIRPRDVKALISVSLWHESYGFPEHFSDCFCMLTVDLHTDGDGTFRIAVDTMATSSYNY
jgi:hypothetical protein